MGCFIGKDEQFCANMLCTAHNSGQRHTLFLVKLISKFFK
jgi:hypothetical protein